MTTKPEEPCLVWSSFGPALWYQCWYCGGEVPCGCEERTKREQAMGGNILGHEGAKYLKTVTSCVDGKSIQADIYDVLEAWGVTCPARQQAIKKLLQCGNRGKGSPMADLKGAEAAVSRAIDLQKQRDHQAAVEHVKTLDQDKVAKMATAAAAYGAMADLPAPKAKKK